MLPACQMSPATPAHITEAYHFFREHAPAIWRQHLYGWGGILEWWPQATAPCKAMVEVSVGKAYAAYHRPRQSAA